MKKSTLYASMVALTFGILFYSTTKSYASVGTHLLSQTQCCNSQGVTVAYGCECVSGDRACIENGCPKGTCQL